MIKLFRREPHNGRGVCHLYNITNRLFGNVERYSKWCTDTELIVNLKRKIADKKFDEHLQKEIKEIICEKQK